MARPSYPSGHDQASGSGPRGRAKSAVCRQDEIARIVLQLAGADDASPVALSDDERAAIEASKDAAGRGEFATDEQIRALWAKHGP